jgi:hypothetical protein
MQKKEKKRREIEHKMRKEFQERSKEHGGKGGGISLRNFKKQSPYLLP